MTGGISKIKRYDWNRDDYKLKVDGHIPHGRCFHCARAFRNADIYAAFCSECHESMSVCPDGPEHDFDSFAFPKQWLDARQSRKPIPFEEEADYYSDQGTNFYTAAGKPVK